MKCSNCGSKFPYTVRFCGHCGHRFTTLPSITIPHRQGVNGKNVISLLLAFVFIASLIIFPSQGNAQGDVDQTVYMSNGEVKRITINGQPDEFKIRVYKKNNESWKNQKITARGRLTKWNCDYDLTIYGSYPRDGGAGTSFNTSTWSNWAVLFYNQQYIAGYSEDNFFDVILNRNNSGSCWTSDPYNVEIEIWLPESELPPTEPPITEPPVTEPPATEPPIVPPAPTTAQFWADTYHLIKGECTTLHWNVTNGTAYWDGESTYNSATTKVCPPETTRYVLKVIGEDGRSYNQELTIYVDEPAPPPAPPLPPSTEIEYWADKYELESGECTTLHWKVTNAESVIWDGKSTALEARVDNLCPPQTTTYKLQVTGMDGKTYERDVTIVVKAPEPACKPSLLQTNYLLIVTDTRKLNESLGGYNAWDSAIRPQLDMIYSWSAVDCKGVPYYLDLAEVYPTGYYWPQVGSAIREFITTQMEGFVPGAVAIIGGPNVVPMAELTTTADDETVYTDDLHVDFDRDSQQLPDIPITRLPDGHNGILLNNYLSAFRTHNTPPAGTTIFSDLSISKEQTSLGYYGFPVLKDIFTGQDGEFTMLLAPPWKNLNERMDIMAMGNGNQLISPSDQWNFNPPGNGVAKLNVKNLLFNMRGRNNSGWWILDPLTKEPTVVFDVNTVKNIPGEGGWHVFSMVDHSANLNSGNQTPDNSIPLQFLYRGAHHFIGSTTNNYFVLEDCQDVSSYGLQVPICHFGLKRVTGDFAQTYYRLRSDDPATSFWLAKIVTSGQNRTGVDSANTYKTLHSFQFFGLPEPGPALGTLQHPTWTPDQELYSDMPIHCPSNDRRDCDADGLFDKEETWVANTFTPIYLHAIKDVVPLENIIYEVTLREDMKGQQIVVFTSSRLYRFDYIPGNLDGNNFSHFGDGEPVEVWLLRQPGVADPHRAPQTPYAIYQNQGINVAYSIYQVVLHRHAETFRFQPDNRELTWQDTHALLYISEGKHAAYFSRDECNASPKIEGSIKEKIKRWLNKGYWHEVCSYKHEVFSAGTGIYPYLSITMNVGERHFHPYGDEQEASAAFFTKMEENPYLAKIFPNDRVWGDNDQPTPLRFCGGYRLSPPDITWWDKLQPCGWFYTFMGDMWPIDPNQEACYAEDGTIDWLASEFMSEKICAGANDSKWCGGDSDRYCGGYKTDAGTISNALREIPGHRP